MATLTDPEQRSTGAVHFRLALVVASVLFAPYSAAQMIGQRPLLTNQSGAKPNLMISFDNSGSMAYPYHETYGVHTDVDDSVTYQVKCQSGSSHGRALSVTMGSTPESASQSNSSPKICYSTSFGWIAPQGSSIKVSGGWSAQRSAEVNPLYYNPRITYLPRVGSDGKPLIPSDGIQFVTNQTSTWMWYTTKSGAQRHANLNQTMHSDASYGVYASYRIPVHEAKSSPANGDKFTYAQCNSVISEKIDDDNFPKQVGCNNPIKTTITWGTATNITLPSNHKRTDCNVGGNTNICSSSQEIANILNWYRYYINRQLASSTAVGQSLANEKLQGKIRVGYINFNEDGSAIGRTPGVDLTNTGSLRGVRLLETGNNDANTLYSWLYGQTPRGGTPPHNATDKVARYYVVDAGPGNESIFNFNTTASKENPWSSDPSKPASATNPELTCRRSFNLLFSDGAWNSGSSTLTNGTEYDNAAGPAFTRILPNKQTQSFAYNPKGDSTNLKAYIPYPSASKAGLADLTARYFWHHDLRPKLANEIQTRPGQPAFWQNMATYTVGYLIQPTGEITKDATDLTFKQIEDWERDFPKGLASTKPPAWPTEDLNSSNWSDQFRIDDYIQAGFTGGGRGYSARTADDVRSIFDIILSDILNSSGNDAGVAVSADTNNNATLVGRLKYSVSYKTIDNSGDIIAQELDDDGFVKRDALGEPVAKWRASDKILAHDKRNIFSYSNKNSSSFEFKGNFSALPSDAQAALKYGPDASRVANDASFINYLRGLDPVADANGKNFRLRESKIGAMVNPPSIYMGGVRDFAYDLSGNVDGSSSYLAYADLKRTLPATLLVATNAGMVHNLDAKEGTELAAFMPRRSMKRMLNFAKDPYSFEYTLDGPLSEHDIYDGKNWQHIAVGTGGRGEKLIYALRSPLNATSNNRNPSKEDYLWETGPTKGPETIGSTNETNVINDSTFSLGHITQPSRSGQTLNGEWVVVLNSGHYNDMTDGKGHGLVVLDAMTGEVIRKVLLPATANAGRGLSGVTLVRNQDKRIVAAYAGDARGQLWRFDLRGKPSEWKVSYGEPVFVTANNRPIYGAPAWQVHPEGGTIVVVATGMLLEESDISDTAVNESIYGIWDPTPVGEAEKSPFTTVPTSSLLVQSINKPSGKTVDTTTYFTASKAKIDWKTHRGWTMALGHTHTGERNIDQVRNVGTSVFVNTTVIKAPENTDAEFCSLAGQPINYIYGLRALDGSTQYSFDIDNDGRMDNYSIAQVNDGGYSRGIALVNIIKGDITESIRKRLGIDTDSGESEPTPQKCVNVSKKAIGTVDGSLSVGVYCPISSWNRTQFQLSSPPSN